MAKATIKSNKKQTRLNAHLLGEARETVTLRATYARLATKTIHNRRVFSHGVFTVLRCRMHSAATQNIQIPNYTIPC